MPVTPASEAVARLASRAHGRTEAEMQADLYMVLMSGGFALDPGQVARLEVPTGDGTRRRLDVAVGHCVIEVKKDLRLAGVRREAEIQLAGYVATQSQRLGTRYVGILTDGTDWYLYHLSEQILHEVAHLAIPPGSPDLDRLIVWLEAILATREQIKPVPEEIHRWLGANSPAHLLDHATLKSIYKGMVSSPEVQVKRQLWAKLLRTAFGKAFTDDEDLFIDHTLLVLTAEIIAHAVVGFDVSRTTSLPPASIVRGTAFSSAQIHGVVEADFFDWVLVSATGKGFVADLSSNISRFDWSHVEHDVLKVLYESVIPANARASLGEYYTPDWLADRIVDSALSDPLREVVLDPACGSGTFVFHAVRAYLAAADAANIPNGQAVEALTEHVYGMDIHPVAVTLARVTYLLAIGKDRLAADDRGPIAIPVYLGDSLQWEQRRDLLSSNEAVTISTAGDDLVEAGGGALFGDDLVFPRSLLQDANNFDRLVSAMADKAVVDSNRNSVDLIMPTFRQFGIHGSDVSQLVATFDTMRRLHRSERDHVWGYYVRNLIRPLWLSQTDHQVDVLVGNPPWLRYSKMTGPMQDRYKTLAKERGLLTGSLGASGRDLSTLFVARSVELYLKFSGRFSFVMPYGTLTRKPHEGFRSGRWKSPDFDGMSVTFSESWDLSQAPTGFPMVSCVIHGKPASDRPGKMPTDVKTWSTRLRAPNISWSLASSHFTITSGTVTALDAANVVPSSPYKARFRNGAILYPRCLMFVEKTSSGPLGAGAGRVKVLSRRSTIEKEPWKLVESLEDTVESRFVRDVHLGETLLPFRMLRALSAVLPIDQRGILSVGELEENPGLSSWWSKAEDAWKGGRVPRETLSLLERMNYHNQLGSQIPTARNRVLYTASGNSLAAARIDSPEAIIEHKLYWAAVSSVTEARYLTGILNSSAVLERVKPLQALGLFGTRDFDKNVFSIPIPTYDSTVPEHARLVALAAAAEEAAAEIDISPIGNFKQARGVIRRRLIALGLTHQIDEVVRRIIPATALP